MAVYQSGFIVKGLAILGEAGFETWYMENIATPDGGFWEVAESTSKHPIQSYKSVTSGVGG
jgi:hypothetical protein